MSRLRAAAALPLTGRYAHPAGNAAAGLRAWADHAGARLEIVDGGDDADRLARLTRKLAGGHDLLFGPYGSGAMRAVARDMAGERAVVWNHGGAALDRREGRIVDVLAPAERYWSGLAPVIADRGIPLDRVVVLHVRSGFGDTTAAGAVASLRGAGVAPLAVEGFGASSAEAAAARALAAGARFVVGCGRIEDDLALGRALAGQPVGVGLVVCGVALAADELGEAAEGWIGPAQWIPGDDVPPVALPPDADYLAAQAIACGLVAQEALERAGSSDPDALWDAARALRTSTFFGPFAVDGEGRQTAHSALIVSWERRGGRLMRESVWRPAQ